MNSLWHNVNLTGCHTKVKDHSLLYDLPIAEGY